MESIRALAHQHNKKVLVDSKHRHFLRYQGFFLIKPNKEEAENFADLKFHPAYENLETVGKKLTELFNANIVITLGGDGMVLFDGERYVHKKTSAREVYDVSGAGDTVLASLEDAMHIANYAAGYVVSRVGTTVCTTDDLIQILERQS